MRKLFTQALYALLLINSLFLTACDKSENTETPEPATQVACKLLSSSHSDGNLNVDFEYNSKGYITKETMVAKSPSTQVTFIKTLSYNADNQLERYDVTRNGQSYRSVSYQYANGKVSIEKNYSSTGTISSSREYIYGSDNKIVREVADDGATTEYTYDSNGNLAKTESYRNDIIVDKITYENYDAKHNYLKSIQGFYNIRALMSPNNPGRETITFYTNGVADYYEVINYTYKYNSDGYPIEVTRADDQNSYNLVTTNTYKCD